MSERKDGNFFGEMRRMARTSGAVGGLSLIHISEPTRPY